MMGVSPQDSDHPEFVEVDPTGRYGRYNEILGKGSSKTVYRAFDEYEGIEVAWNQVKLNDFLQSPEDLERLYCEIHLLKTLKHKNIMKFYTSWVDTSKRNINFVTELFTSGTLRQYRQKHKRVHIRAVKHWCRQILRGLLYLHNHDPPIIHRDLKCDNIFINGNQGVVKIGDLGLAAILRKSHAAHCVGTPEFMAPEVYKEEYNELVDIYSFGMCVLEIATFDYPYSECTHPAEIYKKVISGSKPEALYRVEDPEVRQFVEKCLATASQRLSARELLEDPFLRFDDQGSGSWEGDISKMCQILRQPSYELLHGNESLISNGFADDRKHELRRENGWCHDALRVSNGSLIADWFDDERMYEIEAENGWDYNALDFETHGINLFDNQEDEPFGNVDITIKGRRREDGGIFLRLRIADKEGRVRNIYFPFDIETDTALAVAAEMVGELDITDHDVTRIAAMIDGEVSLLVPEWKLGPVTEEKPGFPSAATCHNCASNVSSCGSILNYLSIDNPDCHNCASMHGRFEEITYQVEGSEQCLAEGVSTPSTSQSEVLDLSSRALRESHSDEEGGQFDQSANCESEIQTTTGTQTGIQQQSLEAPESRDQCSPSNISDNFDNKINQEPRQLKPKYRMELRDHRVKNGVTGSSAGAPLKASSEKHMKSFHSGKHFSFCIPPRRNLLQTTKNFCDTDSQDLEARRLRRFEANPDGGSGNLPTAKSVYAGVHMPSSHHRTKSLPGDANM